MDNEHPIIGGGDIGHGHVVVVGWGLLTVVKEIDFCEVKKILNNFVKASLRWVMVIINMVVIIMIMISLEGQKVMEESILFPMMMCLVVFLRYQYLHQVLKFSPICSGNQYVNTM